MDKTVCIVFAQRWPNQGVMQTIAEEKRESLSKAEGGTVVKKNLYPPPASLFAPTQACKTLCVMQHVKIQRRLPPGIHKATRLNQRCGEEMTNLDAASRLHSSQKSCKLELKRQREKYEEKKAGDYESEKKLWVAVNPYLLRNCLVEFRVHSSVCTSPNTHTTHTHKNTHKPAYCCLN